MNSEQKRLDRPDREKIAKWLCGESSSLKPKADATPEEVSRHLDWLWGHGSDKRERFLKKADQILALIPDIEAVRKQAIETIKGIEEMYEEDEANTVGEAKKQERERIANELEGLRQGDFILIDNWSLELMGLAHKEEK